MTPPSTAPSAGPHAPRRPAPWAPPNPLPERLSTPRTTIRWWTTDDAPGMLAALDAGRDSELPWLPWVHVDNRNVAECIYRIEQMRRDREKGADYAIGVFDRATGQTLGGTGFHRIDLAAGTAEIGYWLRPECRGQGLTTEVVRHLISWAFTPQIAGGWGFRRVVIFCAGGNAASRRVCDKIGLRQELHARHDRWVEGLGWHDSMGWGVLDHEWDLAAHAPRARDRDSLR